MTNPFRQDRPANILPPQVNSIFEASDKEITQSPVTTTPPETTRRRKQVKFDTALENIDARVPAQEIQSPSFIKAHQIDPLHYEVPHDTSAYHTQQSDLSSEDEDEPEVAGRGIYMPITHEPASTDIPPNPFAKTLATIEPIDSQNADYETRSHLRVEASEETGSNRGSMDVNAFTQMLLGRKEPVRSLASDQIPPTTDGIIERRTSQASDVTASHGTVVEQAGQVTSARETSFLTPLSDKPTKPKPPPPRHKHGKPVSEAKNAQVVSPGPQVVSFDDFAASFSATNPTTQAQSSSNRNSLNLSNRPLPAPPPPANHHGQAINTIPSSPSTESLQSTEGAKPSKKPAPPPPMARRSSNLRHEVSSSSSYNRPRSGTTSSVMSEGNDDNDEPSLASPRTSLIHESGTTSKVPPPPPPARRSGAHRDSNSMPALQRQGSAASSTNQRPGSSASTKGSLPQAISRDRSISQVPQTSNSGMAPPPPPPRRTSSRSSVSNSARTSIDLTGRTSNEFHRSSAELRRSSNSSQKGVGAPIAARGSRDVIDEEVVGIEPSSTDQVVDQANNDDDEEEEEEEELALARTESATKRSSKDVLADMDAFQREIDELRLRYAKQKSPPIHTTNEAE